MEYIVHYFIRFCACKDGLWDSASIYSEDDFQSWKEDMEWESKNNPDFKYEIYKTNLIYSSNLSKGGDSN